MTNVGYGEARQRPVFVAGSTTGTTAPTSACGSYQGHTTMSPELRDVLAARDSELNQRTALQPVPDDKKKTLLIARFPGSGSERMETADWLVETAYEMGRKSHPAHHWIKPLRPKRYTDTPIDMVRNRAVAEAKAAGVDYLVMVDSDMAIDYGVGVDPRAKPFLPTALDWMLQFGKPCVCGVPYVGPPPFENVYVFKWATPETRGGNFVASLEQFGREEATVRRGVEQVAALATGCVVIDMRVFDLLPHPHFYYEYDDERRLSKASTEDVTFSRDLAFLKVPQFVFWDCWAGHMKTKLCPRPEILPSDFVCDRLLRRAAAGRKEDEVTVALNPQLVDWPAWVEATDFRDRIPVSDASVRCHSRAFNPAPAPAEVAGG